MCKNIPSLIALSIHALTAVRLQPPRVKTQIAPNTAIIPEEDGTKKKKHSKPLTIFFRYALLFLGNQPFRGVRRFYL